MVAGPGIFWVAALKDTTGELLCTYGSRPEMLSYLLHKKLIDYTAMDIKAPLEEYSKTVRWQVPVQTLRKGIGLIMHSGIQYEFRTTVARCLTSKDDLRTIVRTIKGAKNYYLQRFVSAKLNDPTMTSDPSYSDHELKALAVELGHYVGNCRVR